MRIIMQSVKGDYHQEQRPDRRQLFCDARKKDKALVEFSELKFNAYHRLSKMSDTEV